MKKMLKFARVVALTMKDVETNPTLSLSQLVHRMPHFTKEVTATMEEV